MKNLNVILSRTVLIGLMSLSMACEDKKKESESDAIHEQEMHDDKTHQDHEMHEKDMPMDGENHSQHHDKASMMVTDSNLTSSVIDDYLAIKDALVKDDEKLAAKSSKQLLTSIASFDMNALESSKQSSTKEILDSVKAHAEEIANQDLANQRSHFAKLNEEMKSLVELIGSDRMLYEQYCPMYNNNAGGAWLSATEDIKNPLFGSQMLKCGAVKQVVNIN